MSSNQFIGFLPMEMRNLKILEHLDILENLLFGEIPTTLKNCVKLEFLAMRRNFFQGDVPSSLELLRGLTHFDLSDNNFSGKIPKFLETFDFLQLLNLSYNHFDGEVPTNGVFKNASAILLKGNDELCEGIRKFQLPKCKNKKFRNRNLTLTLKLVIISILFGLIIGANLVLSFKFLSSLGEKRKENASTDSINLLANVSYQSLLNAIVGFSSANLIGVGSFGSVYKSILDQYKHIVAIKVMNLGCHGASKSFKAKCEALRNIRHQNLEMVLTACSSIDYQGHDFKALAYKFLENGNLDEWLHPTTRKNEALVKQRKLSLLHRLNIAIDTPSALDYLHNHCDLKPSNVLLYEEMIGHVITTRNLGLGDVCKTSLKIPKTSLYVTL